MAASDILDGIVRAAMICYPTRSSIKSAYAAETQWEVLLPSLLPTLHNVNRFCTTY